MKIGIDFCIIDNPFNTSNKPNLLVFITKEGLEYLEDETKDTEGYKVMVLELKSLGFLETDNFRFEFIQNEDMTKEPDENTIINRLEDKGAIYSDKLENALYEDLNQIKSSIDLEFINTLIKEAEQITYDSSIDEAFSKLHSHKEEVDINITDETKLKMPPKIKEHISLNMYLFVDLFFKDEDKFVVDISGGFRKEDVSVPSGMYRSMVKIFSDNFKRVNYKKNPDIIELVSTKTKKDLLQEISFLYDVSIDVVKAQKFNDKKFIIENEPKYYNILNLKENIDNLNECIYFEVSPKDFHKMLTISDNIDIERKSKQNTEIIEVDEVLDECYFFIDIIESDMKKCAYEEDFEEALILKDISNSLRDKVENFTESLNGRELISIEEFHVKLNSDV